MLDKRLKLCADMVVGEGIVCDVGTDHAYLAADLILSGKCSKVIASDVKIGPLEAAEKTVERYGISDRVQLILSDGLDNVPLDGVSDVVIAGMGGETIAEIVGNAAANSAKFESIRWILQPMSKPELLRKRLYEYGLKITSEKIAEDGEKLYVVMAAEMNNCSQILTEAQSYAGFFNDNDELAAKYRGMESESISGICAALERAGKHEESVHYHALADKLKNGVRSADINEIYSYLNEIYPFNLQESWDNSGLLVENYDMKCDTVVLTLDITNQAIAAAEAMGAQLIISHHPVIFSPLKRLSVHDPAYRLAEKNIVAICMHTNVDKSPDGTNGVILSRLAERFELCGQPEIFEECGSGLGIGWVCELNEAVSREELGAALKEIFGCAFVKMNSCGKRMIKRLAFCSGSGGSMLELAIEKECDGYITGDVKHDVWIDANNRGISLYDCGHFHTENPVLRKLRCVIEERFPQLNVEISECSADPVEYMR
ncbi:MAG: Nif3-like dinuclear metal center hexameric protein [Ruminococcus sp.]|nr:Nif3-like dinuclear metal center hexameric protein [Ruminococcus sp.]